MKLQEMVYCNPLKRLAHRKFSATGARRRFTTIDWRSVTIRAVFQGLNHWHLIRVTRYLKQVKHVQLWTNHSSMKPCQEMTASPQMQSLVTGSLVMLLVLVTKTEKLLKSWAKPVLNHDCTTQWPSLTFTKMSSMKHRSKTKSKLQTQEFQSQTITLSISHYHPAWIYLQQVDVQVIQSSKQSHHYH